MRTANARFSQVLKHVVLVLLLCHNCVLRSIHASDVDCSKLCEREHDKVRFGGDLLDKDDLRSSFRSSRDALVEQLKEDYGAENFANMFNKNGQSIGRTAFSGASRNDLSWNRLKRKFIIKILTAQQAISKERKDRDKCSCTSGSRRRRLQGGSSSKTEDEPVYADFFWANGGHSASAGHGNFHRESYTAVLDRAVKPIFQSIGISFRAINHAMGGTSSGPEVALCMEAVFGRDIDTITWDYGMTDGRYPANLLLYAFQAAMTRRRPAIIGFVGPQKGRITAIKSVESMGMAGFYLDPPVEDEVKSAIPDTLGLSSTQIQNMPPYVKELKCGGQIELGEPGCFSQKYNETMCSKRKYKAKWHPGWKDHALRGNLLAMFVVEVLMDALEEVAQISIDDREEKLSKLVSEEIEEYANIKTGVIPTDAVNMAVLIKKERISDIDRMFLYQANPFCHTALLPAEIRYKGLLTETPAVEDPAYKGDYEVGLEWSALTLADKQGNSPVKDQEAMPLVYDNRARYDCPEVQYIDYKDYFYVSSAHGWKSMLIPNDSERSYYEFDSFERAGVVFACLSPCDWGKCKDKGDMHDFLADDDSPVKMKINNKPVVKKDKIGSCYALAGKGNGHYWEPNEDGKFLIEAKVVGEGSEYRFIRFSSFILM